MGGVQGRHPAGRLEDHRVALDQSVLVADAAAGKTPVASACADRAAFSIWLYTVST